MEEMQPFHLRKISREKGFPRSTIGTIKNKDGKTEYIQVDLPNRPLTDEETELFGTEEIYGLELIDFQGHLLKIQGKK